MIKANKDSFNKSTRDLLKFFNKHIASFNEKKALVGVFKEATYPDNKRGTGKRMNVADVARIQEYGTHNIPPRPFLHPAVKQNREKALKVFKRALEQGSSVEVALQSMAQNHVDAIKKYIIDLREPANALSTIKAKGSSNPLVDTGYLVRNGIRAKIVTRKR